MYRARVIPCLLLRGQGLVKTRKFKDAVYVGDPVNAVRIFSEKEADELVLLDIDASCEGREPNFDLISEVAGESLMPIAYGGGISNLGQIKKLIRSGVEKVVVTSAATISTDVITHAATTFGSQAIVAGVDVRKSFFGKYKVVANSNNIETDMELEDYVRQLVAAGAGEIFVNSIDRDGMMEGFDLDLIRKVAQSVNVPVVVCGGAGTPEHLVEGIREGGASAVAAGSMFVFHGRRRAVLINYSNEFASLK